MTHYITAEEAKVIALAAQQGKEYLSVTVYTPNGKWETEMCGFCGRIVHHPECPAIRRGF